MHINVIFQTVSFYIYSYSLVVSHSYLCIWVNRCSIISQVIKSTVLLRNNLTLCSRSERVRNVNGTRSERGHMAFCVLWNVIKRDPGNSGTLFVVNSDWVRLSPTVIN